MKQQDTPINTTNLTPRLIRMRDAPRYVGMDRHNFNKLVRPCLTEVPIGRQGIAFDRLEIDAWIEDYMRRNGRRPIPQTMEDERCQSKTNVTKCLDYASKGASIKSRNAVSTSKVAGSEKARKHLAALKQKATLLDD